MEKIKDRIREVRKQLSLSQKVFGENIHLVQNSIANIESGRRNPSTRTILDICRYYNVNEIWLRTGEGDMFIDEMDNELNQLFDKLEADELDRQLFMTYFEMSPEHRQIIKNWFIRATESGAPK